MVWNASQQQSCFVYMAWYGSVYHGMLRCGMVWSGMVSQRGISCISAPLSHASLHLPALHATPPYTSSSEAAPSSSSTPTSINFFQPLSDTFLSGKARRSLDRNCFSISNFLQGSARASLDLPRWILWSRSGFAHWRQLPHHCTLVADTDMKWHLPLICNKTTTLAAAFLGQVAIQSSSKFVLSQSDPPLIGKVLKELYYGNVITIVDDAHNCDFPSKVSLKREKKLKMAAVQLKRSLTARMRIVPSFQNEQVSHFSRLEQPGFYPIITSRFDWFPSTAPLSPVPYDRLLQPRLESRHLKIPTSRPENLLEEVQTMV